jgi:hypothetical protein
MKNCVIAIALTLPGCATVPTVADAHTAVIAAEAVSAVICAEPVPHELVEPCEVLKVSLAKAQLAAEALVASGVK